MTEETDFARIPPKPTNWDELFAITGELRDVPISEIERGRVDWEYYFDTNDMRPCGRQGCAQKHAHGWLVALSGRRFVHIGNNCAANYAEVGIWNSGVKSYRERVAATARATALVEVRDAAQLKQHWLDSTPEIQSAVKIYESFVRQAAGPFLSEIEKRAERGYSTIEKDHRLSDEEMEMRRAMLSGGRQDEQPGRYIAAVEKVAVGQLAGLECFRPLGNPRDLQLRLQNLVTTLLSWSPAGDDRDAHRSLVKAMRDLGPLSNQLNSSLVAVGKFFTEQNLNTLMLLDVTRSQGITSIKLDGAGEVLITRRAHWGQRAA